jgi:phosphoribosylformylglycinamidine cyclo-ligase
MEFYVPEQQAKEIISISNNFNVAAQVVGRVEASTSKKLTLQTPLGDFIYS